MQSLKFKRLLILSDSQRSANQFQFGESLNLITADENGVGKSTLVKLLFWGLGCEPSMDTTWSSLDCSTIIDFSVGEYNYAVKRSKAGISLKVNENEYVNYIKVGGEFSEKFASITGFKALLPNRSNGQLEIPPPAFYFLPFYIDQKRSWGKAWDNFEKLGQYDRWKNPIIRYHVGLLTPSFFELEAEKAEKRGILNKTQIEVDKIENALEIVEQYIPRSTLATIDDSQLRKMTSEIRVDLSNLQENQEELLNNMTELTSEKVYLEQQLVITSKIILELEKDYEFTIENIEEEEIECPLCGVVHENTIVNRTSIMTDKIQAENQLHSIQNKLKRLNTKLTENKEFLKQIRQDVSSINEKYLINEEDKKIDLNQLIESVAGNSIKKNVIENKSIKLNEIYELGNSIKRISSAQKNTLSKEEKEEINNSFNHIFRKYAKLLDAEAVNLSQINTPLDYSKVIKEGGAADGSRAILAYYLTIFTMVEQAENEVKSPLVVDTPNQHEQSHTNYERIVDILINQFTSNSQIILCAMENELLDPLKERATVITLNKNKLLDRNKYREVKNIFNSSL